MYNKGRFTYPRSAICPTGGGHIRYVSDGKSTLGQRNRGLGQRVGTVTLRMGFLVLVSLLPLAGFPSWS